jgi:hypothetical protein
MEFIINKKEDDIFPLLGLWNLNVKRIMGKKYPPIESSNQISDEEIEHDKKLHFSNFKIWNLICEEAVDTEHSYMY